MPRLTLPGFRHFALLVLPALLAVSVQAQNLPSFTTPTFNTASVEVPGERGAIREVVRCAAPEPTFAETVAVEAALERIAAPFGESMAGGTVTIPTAYHVIKSGSLGNVTQAMIDSQMNVLNNAFAGTGFQFTLASVDYTTNTSWYNAGPGSTAESSMKSALAISPATTLNFYTSSGGGYLGWSYLPFSFPETSTLHGIVVDYRSLPGGSAFPYNAGDTATHEIGHYLGLYHTFQGGCPAPGDYVSDTAPEASPAFGCPIGRDTCSGGGPDPIRNFMDYVDDACMFEFTAEQASRMNSLTATYKPILYSNMGGGTGTASVEATITGGEILSGSGGRVSADFMFSNTSGATFDGEWWVLVTFPNGSNGPRLGPFDLTLNSGQSTTESLSQRVPSAAPAGVYRVTAYVGPSFPDDFDDSDDFTFFKGSNLTAGSDEARASDDVTWTLENVTRGETATFTPEPVAARAGAALGVYPTPFSERTTVRYALEDAAEVRVAVYDVLGRRVALLAEGMAEAGPHEATFEADGLPSGVYLVRLEAGGRVQTQQITLMK